MDWQAQCISVPPGKQSIGAPLNALFERTLRHCTMFLDRMALRQF